MTFSAARVATCTEAVRRSVATTLALLSALACMPAGDADQKIDTSVISLARGSPAGAEAPTAANGSETGPNDDEGGRAGGAGDTLAGVPPAAEAPPPRKGPRTDASRLPPARLIDRDPVSYLRALDLLIPVAGMSRDELPPSSFADARGTRTHEAYDIHAARGTPVLAATGGEVAKLHVSEAGGNMVYTYDESGRFVLFYAHLDRYHSSMREGLPIARGDTLGYVGSTGNAPPTVPHLHFAIVLMDEDRRWWKGTPIDPQPILAREPR